MQIYGTDPDEIRLGRLVDDDDPLFRRMRLFHFRFSTIYVEGAAKRVRKALDYAARTDARSHYTHNMEEIGGTVRSAFEDAVRTIAEKARVRSGRTMECVLYIIVADLPQDSTGQSRRLAMQMVEAYWRRRGCAVLWVIHKPGPGDSGNWHAHIFLTARRVKRLPDKCWEVDRSEPAILQKVWKRKQARAEYSRAINFACKPERQFFPGTKFELCKQRGKLRLPQWLLPLNDRSEAAIRAAASNREAADYALYALRWNDLIRLKRDPLEDSWIRERRHILREAKPGEPSPPALPPLPRLPAAAPSSRSAQPPAMSILKPGVSPKPVIARPAPVRPERPIPIHASKPQPMPQAKPRALTADEATQLKRIDDYIDRLDRREGEHRLDFEKRLRQTPVNILEDAVQTLTKGMSIARKLGPERADVKEALDLMDALRQAAYRALQIQLNYRKRPDRDDRGR